MLRRTAYLASTVFALSMLTSTGAMASAQRTFVASYGSPANTAFNCSISKPCRAFSEALSVTSLNGEVIVLDSAGYGSVTITKSVSIIAPPGIYAGVTVSSGNGVTINAPGATVVLRGLSINGQGGNRGISVLAAARVRVENCVVSGMNIAGISHTAASAELIVQDTLLRDNVGSGVYLLADLGSIVLDHVRSEHNGGNGVSFTPAAGSLGALATITDSVFTHNEGDGIAADSVAGATITLLVDRSVISNNGQNGFRAASGAGSGVATVSRSAINDNGGHGISIQGSIQAAASENATKRNSGNGALVANARVVLSGNVLIGDLSGAIHSMGDSAVVSISANTAQSPQGQDDVVCEGGLLATFGNNSMFFVGTGPGCLQSTVGSK